MSQSELVAVERRTRAPRPIVRSEKTAPSSGRHFALERSVPATYENTPPRQRPEPLNDLIDDTRFIVDPIRPWPEWPLICRRAHLPSFETEKDAMKWNDGNGHPPILAKWQCSFCGLWHVWSTAHSDSNGAFPAGADVLPERIKELMK